jgi:cation:H+ antiporter
LLLGGKLVVDNAIDIATNFGVSEKVIGLTIIAAGTSLPELMTSIVAAYKKNSDIAIGNIIGSNIFNIFLILSISAFVRPIQYSAAFNTDLYMLLGGAIFIYSDVYWKEKDFRPMGSCHFSSFICVLYNLLNWKRSVIFYLCNFN